MNRASVLVLGAGPAGLSAALWLHNLGLDCLLLEREARLGGMQHFNFLSNEWVLGQTGMTGPMLAERFSAHVRSTGVDIANGMRLHRISAEAGRFLAHFGDIEQRFNAVLVATGTRFRASEVLAGVPGFAGLPEETISYGPYAFVGLDALAGRRVLIVGGGDNAYENARALAGSAAEVHLAVRSQPRAQQHLLDSIDEQVRRGLCRVWLQARPAFLEAGEASVTVGLQVGGRIERVCVDRIHVLAGYEPNSGFMGDVFPASVSADIRRDDEGYVVVDGECRTGSRGIYAAGDICNPLFPCVVSAVAQGALAAKTIERDLRCALPT